MLVVDDEADARDLMQEQLKQHEAALQEFTQRLEIFHDRFGPLGSDQADHLDTAEGDEEGKNRKPR